MKRKKRYLCGFILSMVLTALMIMPCYAAVGKDYIFQLDRTVTNKTTEFEVVFANYGHVTSPEYAGARLCVESGNKIIFSKKCDTDGYMKVKIPAQRTGSVLKIYLKDTDSVSNIKTLKVKKLNSILKVKAGKSVRAPKVSINKKGNYCVYARKGDRLVVKNAKGKTVKTVRYTKTGRKNIPKLSRLSEKSELYLYVQKGNKRSACVVIPKQIDILE